MIERIPMRGGAEYDALPRRAKWRFNWEAGDRKRCKRSYNRRHRRQTKREVERTVSIEDMVAVVDQWEAARKAPEPMPEAAEQY